MQTEHLLYGLAPDENRAYMETLLIASKDPEQIERVITIALRDGWHSFRTATHNGDAPDFVKALNV
jgi:hypothetical protein